MVSKRPPPGPTGTPNTWGSNSCSSAPVAAAEPDGMQPAWRCPLPALSQNHVAGFTLGCRLRRSRSHPGGHGEVLPTGKNPEQGNPDPSTNRRNLDAQLILKIEIPSSD